MFNKANANKALKIWLIFHHVLLDMIIEPVEIKQMIKSDEPADRLH